MKIEIILNFILMIFKYIIFILCNFLQILKYIFICFINLLYFYFNNNENYSICDNKINNDLLNNKFNKSVDDWGWFMEINESTIQL